MEASQQPNGFVSESKFFNRLLTKEGQIGCSSRALYYAAPGAVPFDWESEPGTPKHKLNFEEDIFAAAPLSPPPFLQATASRSALFVSDNSSSEPPLKLSGRVSASSNLSLKFSGAIQSMKGKMKLLRSQHKVHAQGEERYIWRRRSKSCWKKSLDKVEDMDFSMGRRWVPFSLKKLLSV